VVEHRMSGIICLSCSLLKFLTGLVQIFEWYGQTYVWPYHFLQLEKTWPCHFLEAVTIPGRRGYTGPRDTACEGVYLLNCRSPGGMRHLMGHPHMFGMRRPAPHRSGIFPIGIAEGQSSCADCRGICVSCGSGNSPQQIVSGGHVLKTVTCFR